MIEVWKDIPDYNGKYQASSQGRVKSFMGKHPLIMAQSPMRKGYFGVSLRKDNKPKTHQVHVLILKSFIGDRPEGMEGCHNDGKNKNNYIDNLRWDIPKNNRQDAIKHGTNKIGEDLTVSKFKNSEVWLIKKLLSHNVKVRRICEMFKSKMNAIYHIKDGSNWSHIKESYGE